MNIQDIKSEFELIGNNLTRSHIPQIIKKFYPNPILAELGVFQGNGIEFLLTCNPNKIIGIDLWKGDGKIATTDGLPDHIMQEYYELVCNKFKNDSRVEIIRDRTSTSAKNYPNNYFDFVFIDGDHTYNGTFEDIINWYPKVKHGGIISGHDYFQHTSSYKFGVIEAVNDFVFQNTEIDKIYVSNEKIAPCWFIVKIDIQNRYFILYINSDVYCRN